MLIPSRLTFCNKNNPLNSHVPLLSEAVLVSVSFVDPDSDGRIVSYKLNELKEGQDLPAGVNLKDITERWKYDGRETAMRGSARLDHTSDSLQSRHPGIRRFFTTVDYKA